MAKYAVEIKAGIKAKANAEIELLYSVNDDSYKYQSHTQAKGFAKMLRSKPIAEVSEFRIVDGDIQPVSYQFTDGSRKNKRGDAGTFDWAHGIVQTKYKGSKATLKLDNGTLDRNLLPVAIMHTCPNIRSGLTRVVTRGSIRDYQLENLGRETIKTKIGTLDAIKIRQFRVGSSRSTLSWVSPKHQCILVRMHQFKDNKRAGTLEIQNLQIGSGL